MCLGNVCSLLSDERGTGAVTHRLSSFFQSKVCQTGKKLFEILNIRVDCNTNKEDKEFKRRQNYCGRYKVVNGTAGDWNISVCNCG